MDISPALKPNFLEANSAGKTAGADFTLNLTAELVS